MKERISKLLTIASITTLTFVISYNLMIFLNIKIPQQYENIILIIVSFYFGTQVAKAESGKEDKK